MSYKYNKDLIKNVNIYVQYYDYNYVTKEYHNSL